MKRLWQAWVGVVLGLVAGPAGADEIVWRPVAPADSSLVVLHPPRPLETPAVVPASYSSPAPVVGADGVSGDQPNADPLLGGLTPPPPGDASIPPPPPYPPDGTGLPGVDSENVLHPVTANWGNGPNLFDQGKQAISSIPNALGGNGSRCCLQSDHAFDGFCSPVTNPFLMQDPRSLTELKPLLLYQQIPGSNPITKGGDAWFYGLQGRVAISDMFSVVVNKLGFVTLNPHDQTAGATNATGFAEVMLGPQFTFVRCESTGTLLAAGLTFDLPWGSSKVFQDTGDLSLIPYLSFGQSFGNFHFLNTTGYSFATDDRRNDFLYASFHLDYGVDLGNGQKIYPLVELNWLHLTTNGHPPDAYGFDGGDLFNFGNGGVAGHDDLTLGLGARYKFAEWFQVGAAVEIPLVNRDRGFMDYRLQMDLIFRY